MTEQELQTFHAEMKRMGDLFVKKLQEALDRSYLYAPGYKGNAYSLGRKPNYQGSAPKVSTGTLRESIKADYEPSSGSLTLSFVDYWQYVNNGRSAGFYVPIAPLKTWSKSKFGLDDRGATSAAFAISKNIYKFGIQPTNFYDIAAEEMINIIEEAGEEALMIDVETFFENTFEDIIPSKK